jgi:hypothetical protein
MTANFAFNLVVIAGGIFLSIGLAIDAAGRLGMFDDE